MSEHNTYLGTVKNACGQFAKFELDFDRICLRIPRDSFYEFVLSISWIRCGFGTFMGRKGQQLSCCVRGEEVVTKGC